MNMISQQYLILQPFYTHRKHNNEQVQYLQYAVYAVHFKATAVDGEAVLALRQ